MKRRVKVDSDREEDEQSPFQRVAAESLDNDGEGEDDSLGEWEPITKVAISAESFLSDHGIASPKPKESPRAQQKNPAHAKGLTKPISPNLNIEKRFRMDQLSSPPMMTTEQLLLKKLEEERDAERKKIEKRKKLYERLKANGFQLPLQAKETAAKKMTVPKTPKSVLDKKYGKKIPSVLKRSPVKHDLKDKFDQASSHQPKLTIPEPFHFETDKRIQLHQQTISAGITGSSFGNSQNLRSSICQSMTAGELAVKFFQEARSYENTSNNNHQMKRLTEPHSPTLRTAKRVSLVQRDAPLSREEIEAKEVEEIRKHPFKARPLDKRIFESHGEYGVPKVPVKPPTIPVDIELHTDKRAVSRSRDRNEQEEEQHQFKARPLPSFIKEGPQRLPTPPSKKNYHPTIPVSPKFQALSLSREDEDAGLQADEYKELRRASSAPARRQKPHHSLIEMQKKLEEEMMRKPTQKKLTEPKEFHFETDRRGEFYQQQFQQQLQREQEEEMKKREVKALPVPNFDVIRTSSLAPVPPKTLTEPQPFNLRSVDLHEAALEQFHHQIMKEIEVKQKEEEEAKNFKAKPVPKTTYEPAYEVITHNSSLEDKENQENLVKPLNIVLESDKRAEKRKEFDEKLKKHYEDMEVRQKQALLEKETKKKLELKTMRRKSVEEGGLLFKARPVLAEDPFPVKPCTGNKKLTQPKSPNLRLKERREMKQAISAPVK